MPIFLTAVLIVPLAYGGVVDSACLVWEDVCGVTGACQLYDALDLRMKIVIIIVFFNAGGTVLNIIAVFVARAQKTRKKISSVQ